VLTLQMYSFSVDTFKCSIILYIYIMSILYLFAILQSRQVRLINARQEGGSSHQIASFLGSSSQLESIVQGIQQEDWQNPKQHKWTNGRRRVE